MSKSDTPTIPSTSAVLHIHSSTRIAAPIQDVWQTLTDTSTWPRWNRFVPRATVHEQPSTQEDSDFAVLKSGTRFTFHVNMYPENDPLPQPGGSLRATNLRVIQCEPPSSSSESNGTGKRKARIVWASDPAADGFIMSSLLKAERVHELEEVADEDGKVVTEVRNWEAQVGYLAYVVKWLFGGRLRNNFAIWEGGLKDYSEGMQ